MRLALALFKRRNVTHGSQWAGKDKLQPVAYPWNVERYRKRLEVEERNLFYLRHPFLTLEQDRGFKAAMAEANPFERSEQRALERAAKQLKKSVPMETSLGHLNLSTKWEH